MNVIVTGRGTSGSFQIRGVQLGAAIGADVNCRVLDVGGYDVAVIVKRAGPELLARLRRADVPIIWDVVDAYPQPIGNDWPKSDCVAWLRQRVREIRPAAIVAATGQMAADCAEFGVPVLALPHHARPGLARNPIRENVRIVAYEGATHYLGNWQAVVERECARRGWRFVINPAQLADADIVVALRHQNGYAARNWKSGVKAANAMGSGTPFIGCREAGCMELAVGNCARWADTPAELTAAFDALTPHAERVRVAGWMFAAHPTLQAVAATYAKWLRSLEFECATAAKS